MWLIDKRFMTVVFIFEEKKFKLNHHKCSL